MNKKKSKIIHSLIFIFSIFLFFFLWLILSLKIDYDFILPSPFLVFKTLAQLLITKDFWINLAYSFLRIVFAFIISISAGFFLGIICGKNTYINTFLKFPIALMRICPVISIILIVMFWSSSNTVPIIVAVLMTLPIMFSSISKTYSHKDEKLYDLAMIYNFNFFKKLYYIDLPMILPSFLTGSVSVFGMTWKVIVAGEVLSLPKKGLGTILQFNSINMETSKVFAITMVVLIISFSLEQLFIYLVNKRINNNDSSDR